MGIQVGSYLLTTTLGEGSFGKVKLAQHVVTGHYFAVKVLDKDDVRARDLTSAVRREITIMKSLHHRNIVNLLEVVSSRHKLYIVMDLVRGAELYTWLIARKQTLPVRAVRKLFQQLIDGVSYCHHRGVCHRDLKPENIMIGENGLLKIADFGISTMTNGEVLRTPCGTAHYSAPEVLRAGLQGYDGQKADIWSCGVILYLLVCGNLPFDGKDPRELYKNIHYGPFSCPRDMDPRLRHLISGMLDRDPSRRLSVGGIKRHSWFTQDYDCHGANQIPLDCLKDIRGLKYSTSPSKLERRQRVHPGAEERRPQVGDMWYKSMGGQETVASSASTCSASSHAASMRHPSDGKRALQPVSKPLSRESPVTSPMTTLADDGSEENGRGQYLVVGSLRNSPTSSQSSLDSLADENPHLRPSEIRVTYGDLSDLVRSAFEGSQENSVRAVLSRLARIDMDCLEDILVVAEAMAAPEAFRNWLVSMAGLTVDLATRITRVVFTA